MQAELIYRKPTVMTSSSRQELLGSQQQVVHHRATAMPSNRREGRASGPPTHSKDSRETIHSGHFMVSDFEAEAQDDEDELAVPVPDEEAAAKLAIVSPTGCFPTDKFATGGSVTDRSTQQQLSIETSLNKLFQCMSLAYRQKLTSPKWNRFKGIRLRWKDKIRLNNVIWRCWHMQFILKQNTLVCQFASPLDVDTHNKPEAVVLEGKYWKRKLAAVTAEYKKWRMFYRNKILGWTNKDGSEMLESMDMLEWGSSIGPSGNYGMGMGNSCGGTGNTPSGDSMMVDEDYMELMTDTLFSTISSNQPIYFPDPREIARGASLADFIQPSLGPLQPNLDDFMDTLEPLQEFLNSKLPPVPEEDDMFRSNPLNPSYPELDLMAPMSQINDLTEETMGKNEQTQQQQQQTQSMAVEEQRREIQNLQYSGKMFTQSQAQLTATYTNNADMSENYNTIQQSFQSPANTQSARDKSRQSRPSTRSSRALQQRQQQQQQGNTYATNYQAQQAPQQTYAMEIQTVEIPSVQSQQQISTQNEQQIQQNTQQISPLSGHVQNLLTLSTNFAAIQQKPIRGTAAVPVVTTTKPYKIVQPQQQGYKFTPSTQQPFAAQQCKYNSNAFKGIQQQQLVPVAPQQPQTQAQQILLQCRPSPGLDLTAATTTTTAGNLQTTKIPVQAVNNATTTVTVAPSSDKEEVFAVPKFQIKPRNRSRSSSSLNAPRMHPPPLVSTVSDPALNLNNNVLLAHLLTNNSSGIYTTSEKLPLQSGTQSGTMKHILPMLPATTGNTRQNPEPQMQQQQQQPSAAATQAIIQPPTGAVLMNTSNSQSSPGSPKESTAAHSPQGLNLSPLHSPMSIGSPLSPSRGFVKGESERGQYKEQRRVGHIHAEQKRRYNIKNGFDMLHSLIPQLSQNPNTKLSKAAMLQKGADYIRQLRAERNQLKEEMDSLRHQIECLNTSISNCQSMLPATGAPVSRHRTSKMKEMFDEYVRTRTRENWKFWIFSILLEPLMISFNTSVSTASVEDLYRSTILWVEQHCSLVDLRPAVLNSLRYLCTATDILSDPARLPEEALAAVNRTERRRSAN